MILKDIIDNLNSVYPFNLQSEWDNSGLQVGRLDKNIKSVYVAFEINREVIDFSINNKVDLIITHHPLMFNPIKNIISESLYGNYLLTLIENNISVISVHTNFDKISMVSDVIKVLYNKMGYTKDVNNIAISPLDEREGYGGIISIEDDFNYEISLEKLSMEIKEGFSLSTIKAYGEKNTIVKKIGIVPGSGSEFIENAINKGCDTFISSDISHHKALDGINCGINIIDVSHRGIEFVFVDSIYDYIGKLNIKNVYKEEKSEIYFSL